MTLAPIFAASDAVQIHLATIAVAILATGAILVARKGARFHKTMGWIWATAMMITAVVTFWINSFDMSWGVSWIHIFSVVVLVNVPYAILSVRRGNVVAHKSAMLGLAFGGLGVAGAFAFGQGRLMHAVFFGA